MKSLLANGFTDFFLNDIQIKQLLINSKQGKISDIAVFLLFGQPKNLILLKFALIKHSLCFVIYI